MGTASGTWYCSCGYAWTKTYKVCPKCGAQASAANYVQFSTNVGNTDGGRCTHCGKVFEVTDPRYYIHNMILCVKCYQAYYPQAPFTYGNDPNCYGYVMRQGWECPRCHKIWSPTTPACYACNGKTLPAFYSNFYDLGPEKICKMFGWDYERIKAEYCAEFNINATKEEKKS